MQFIVYNIENHPTLNQIYDILAEIQNQDEEIILCKVPAHIGIKGREATAKAAKQAAYRLLPNYQKS